ncbi:MAG: MurR/RpiR family transcriptional regulator [Thermodesulfobacteriota bacterium]
MKKRTDSVETEIPPIQRQLFQRISDSAAHLTAKNKRLADYVLRHYRRVVFMTARELAQAGEVSEATVIRFVTSLGFSGYGEFQSHFRNVINARLTLSDRINIEELNRVEEKSLFRRVILNELSDLKNLFENIEEERFYRVVEMFARAGRIDVVGARVSQCLALYLSWSLQRIRPGVHLLDGSNQNALDALAVAPQPGLVAAITVARYPRSLLNLVRYAKSLGFQVVAITDNLVSPVIGLADAYLVAPTGRFALIADLAALSCLLNCLVTELAHRDMTATKAHHDRLEKFYRDQEVFFDFDARGLNGPGQAGKEPGGQRRR